MTTDLWLRNLTAFGFQSGVLVAGGYLLAKALRIDEPRAALAYWRVILVVCLLLPFCQPWHAVMSQAVVIGETSTSIPQAGARTGSVAEMCTVVVMGMAPVEASTLSPTARAAILRAHQSSATIAPAVSTSCADLGSPACRPRW